MLAVLAAAELLAMAPWFSASAVAPTLVRVWQLSPTTTAWLTISVQLGFVAGALVSAVLTLADRLSARRLVAGSSRHNRRGGRAEYHTGNRLPAAHRRCTRGRVSAWDEDRGRLV